jgi:hypothetical protein
MQKLLVNGTHICACAGAAAGTLALAAPILQTPLLAIFILQSFAGSFADTELNVV